MMHEKHNNTVPHCTEIACTEIACSDHRFGRHLLFMQLLHCFLRTTTNRCV